MNSEYEMIASNFYKYIVYEINIVHKKKKETWIVISCI